ncbi:response regulator [Candidatus Woesearchaeota archaeon]|nr:response regulator [Candidatus Woesearchaeota archaeon]
MTETKKIAIVHPNSDLAEIYKDVAEKELGYQAVVVPAQGSLESIVENLRREAPAATVIASGFSPDGRDTTGIEVVRNFRGTNYLMVQNGLYSLAEANEHGVKAHIGTGFDIKEFKRKLYLLAEYGLVFRGGPHQTPLKVLFVDNEPGMAETYDALLKRKGILVTKAESGEQALGLYNTELNKNDPFDAVITDLNMEGLNGLQLTERIKELHPSTVVLVATTNGTQLEGGMQDGVLIKPFKPKDIMYALGAIMDVMEMRKGSPNYHPPSNFYANNKK